MIKKIEQGIGSLSEVSGRVFAWLLVPISLITFGEVILRYFFNAPTSWGSELTGYLFGVMSFMSGAYCLRYGQHIRMDIIRGRLSPVCRAVLETVLSAFTYLFLGLMIWRGTLNAWETTMAFEHSGTVWNPPYWPFTWFLPVGALLVMLQELTNLTRNLRLITQSFFKEVSA